MGAMKSNEPASADVTRLRANYIPVSKRRVCCRQRDHSETLGRKGDNSNLHESKARNSILPLFLTRGSKEGNLGFPVTQERVVRCLQNSISNRRYVHIFASSRFSLTITKRSLYYR
jgi:hypothetical protein